MVDFSIHLDAGSQIFCIAKLKWGGFVSMREVCNLIF